MELTVYGLMGHAGHLKVPLEELDLDELEAGEEFAYRGKIYQVRSVLHVDNEVKINVTMTMDQPNF